MNIPGMVFFYLGFVTLALLIVAIAAGIAILAFLIAQGAWEMLVSPGRGHAALGIASLIMAFLLGSLYFTVGFPLAWRTGMGVEVHIGAGELGVIAFLLCGLGMRNLIRAANRMDMEGRR